MKSKILFVDDDPAFLRAIDFALSDEFEITLCDSYDEALTRIEKEKFDLWVLDYDLGAKSAEDLMHSQQSTVPVLIITGKAEKNMAIRLLNMRIHGLLEKPVTSRSLLAKIQDILRLAEQTSSTGISLENLNITYYQNRRLVIVGKDEITLTPIENKILETLLENKNQVVKRAEICDSIWGKTSHARNILDTHLYNLKRKIPSLEKALKTVYGDGLVLNI